MPKVSLWIRFETPTGQRKYIKAHPTRQHCSIDGKHYPNAGYALRCQNRWKTGGNELVRAQF
jgi:hypothetical protein